MNSLQTEARNRIPAMPVHALLLLILVSSITGCSVIENLTGKTSGGPREPQAESIDPRFVPPTPREFRAVWIATVGNIDWPSKPGLPVSQQKAELRAIMDRAVLLNMNAVILQVRPSADAFYNTVYEPWSEYLTGEQGKAPEPFYDPLAFAVDEAHRRGLELHAWFNPFRAYHPSAKNGLSAFHIQNKQPELVLDYGRYLWLDPGLKASRQYSIDVILDVVRRYDIDGVHLDDYFYPYTEQDDKGKPISFPDSASYGHYTTENGTVALNDWRRENVNLFVRQLSREIKELKPRLRFGISPFGIWRPGHPEQIKGLDAYDNLFADSRKWLQEGWVDYFAPQLYWSVAQESQSYPVLLEWWHDQNYYKRHLWPGSYTSRVGSLQNGNWSPEEIKEQIQLTRLHPDVTGNIHFSMKSLMNNSGDITEQLLMDVYSEPALVPATTWLSGDPPRKPDATLQKMGNVQVISLSPDYPGEKWLWVVKVRYDDTWKIFIHPGWKHSVNLPHETVEGTFKGAVVSIVDRLGVESAGRILNP